MSEKTIKQLDAIFKAKSIAIIGASNNTGKWGGRTFNRLLGSGFKGDIYPVNPRTAEVFGRKTYPSILDVPGDVDLAVFTIPASLMAAAMADCGKKGVKSAVVITADFAETGEAGKTLEAELVRVARAADIRFVGPNCMGIWSSAVDLNFAVNDAPKKGGLAFISQSGSYGGAVARKTDETGLGLSKFISIGNQADIGVYEYLAYLAQDPDTKAIAMYIEGLKDGRRFFETARKVTKIKPVLVFKGGSSPQGAQATLSHTASIAGEDRIFDAMCRQAGIIRVEELHHLLIMAESLIHQPLAKGNRIAVVGSGGQGVVTVDFLAKYGIETPTLKEKDQLAIKKFLPPHAPMPKNPVDFAGGTRKAEEEAHVVDMLASLDYIDGIITSVPSHVAHYERKSDYLIEASRGAELFCDVPQKYDKPVITQPTNVTQHALIMDILKENKIPIFTHPEDSVRAMAALVLYGRVRNDNDIDI